jgi:hypothetical protein
MRLWIACLVLLAGCSPEPSFHEKYHTEAERIEHFASNIQEQMDQQLSASDNAGRLSEEREVSSGNGTK